MTRIFQKRFIHCFIVAAFLFIGTTAGIAQELSKDDNVQKQKGDHSFSIEALRNLPIMHEGRYKPFDSIARQTLLALSGKGSSVKDDKGGKYTASEWLAESIFIPEQSGRFKIFLLENPDVADAIGLKSEMERVRYSYNDIGPHFDEFEKLVKQAISVHSGSRSRFQRHLLQFYNQLFTFIDLEKKILPGMDDKSAWSDITTGYIMKDQEKFDNAIEEYKKSRMKNIEAEVFADAKREALFNRIDPFFNSGLILCLALIFALYGLGKGKKLNFTLSMVLCVAALLLQTYGHGVRMLVMGRPPVTNLYSTFISVAWICSFVGIIIVKLLPKAHRGLSPLLASLGPLIFLIIAGKYAYSGDTMGVMVAVLDSNFWLAAHVVTITLGYGGCILAGLFAHYYIIQICRTDVNNPDTRSLYKILLMIFGFGFTMTFIGGVLTGGIWADQSWGRFWGWDPKENGTLLLVLWCAVVFHVKAGNLMNRFWIAVGTIITIFVMLLAWFGVNKLGVGFHSYGNDPDSRF
ncbi:MAG: cytochrome c biogenesis protein CcsA, partial [Desulfobacteraceae bacterium]